MALLGAFVNESGPLIQGPERDNPLDAVLTKLSDAAELSLSLRAPRVAEWRNRDTLLKMALIPPTIGDLI